MLARLGLGLLLCWLCCLPSPAATEEKLPAPRQQLYEEILDSLINPCPAENATVLHSNPTCGHANRIRAQVRAMVLEGKTKDEIIDAIVAEYTDNPTWNETKKDLRALPGAHGFGLAAWIAPGCVLLVFGALIVLRLRVWKHRSAHAPALPATAEAAHRRIEEELSELRNP